MKCTKVILGGLIAGVAMVNAMPTLEQTKKVEPLVMGLMREDQNALKSGKKTRAEVAQSAMELADKAESEAAKLLLMKGALNLYVRAGAFDKAIETLHSLKAAIPDIPQPIVTNMIETALRGAAKNEDGELFHKLIDEYKAEVGASGIQTEKFPLARGIDLEMIKCPAGEFMMGYESWKTWGSASNREQRKLHRVKLTKDFMLGKFPVTYSQWYAIMENGKEAPKELEDTPVGNITVSEMEAFCEKLTAKFKAQLGGKVFRLPTDAEWEYASKGGKNLDGMLGKTLGFNGNTGSLNRDGKEVEAILRQMGYTAEDHASASDTKEPCMWNPLAVGKHKPNEWGFMDFTGNAWEVTADKMMDNGKADKNLHTWNRRQRYPDFEIDPLLKGERHLVRTGFWYKGIAHGIGNKMSIGDNDRFPAVGFRVCIGEPLVDWNNATTTTPKLVKDAFSLNAAPGSIKELDLGNVPPLQFVYCPAGKFSMGYKKHPAISKVKDIEITSPFWVSKTVIRADQLESLGINFATNSITNGEKREAWISDASIVVQKLPSVLKERFGKMLPPGYVFRLPTEAEFEYLQKAETNDKNAQTNIWGVERLYSGGYIGLLDRAPAYGRGVDVVNETSDDTVWTNLVKVNYDNQPDKNPVGWSDNPNWSVFRRGLARNCGGGKLITNQRSNKLYGFYFVVAPDVDKLNKFYWK